MIILRIFLIDHAWTYKVSEARKHLRAIDGLAARMQNLMNIKIDEEIDGETETYNERVIDAIIENMWKFNQTYNFTTDNMVCKKLFVYLRF